MITREEILREIRKRGKIDLAAVSTTSGSNKWYLHKGWLSWHTPNNEEAIELADIAIANPPIRSKLILLTENGERVDKLDRGWVLARLAGLPYTAAPTTPTPGVVPTIPPGMVPRAVAIFLWLISIGFGKLTEDHARYLYQLAKGRVTAAEHIYNSLSPKPQRAPAAIVTEDTGRGVFQYAKGRKAAGNKITGCKF